MLKTTKSSAYHFPQVQLLLILLNKLEIRLNMLKAVLPYLLPKELSINGEVVNEEEQEIKPPAVIVFGDSKEYKAYNEMSEEEKDKMVEEATPLFGNK